MTNVNLQSVYQSGLTLFQESVAEDTDIYDTDITIGNDNTVTNQFNFTKGMTLTFEGAFEAVGNFYFVIKDSNGTESIMTTNGGNDSTNENAGFTFNVTLIEGYSLNIRYSATTTCNWMSVSIHGGKI